MLDSFNNGFIPLSTDVSELQRFHNKSFLLLSKSRDLTIYDSKYSQIEREYTRFLSSTAVLIMKISFSQSVYRGPIQA